MTAGYDALMHNCEIGSGQSPMICEVVRLEKTG